MTVREINSKSILRKYKKEGFIAIGGGVGDSYQPVESKYRLTRNALILFLKYKLPAHILTKNILIERDIDLLKEIKDNLQSSKGVGNVTERIIKEILNTGTSKYYEKLIVS